MDVKSPFSRLQIAIFGAGTCDDRLRRLAYATGALLARSGARLVCGGRGGVMAAAARGARDAGGQVVGVLPGRDAADSPPDDAVDVALYTGLGQARNLIVVLSGAAAIAIGGSWGTLSEIALALKHGIPVVTLESWSLRRPDGRDEPLLRTASTPEEAVALALELAELRQTGLG